MTEACINARVVSPQQHAVYNSIGELESARLEFPAMVELLWQRMLVLEVLNR